MLKFTIKDALEIIEKVEAFEIGADFTTILQNEKFNLYIFDCHDSDEYICILSERDDNKDTMFDKTKRIISFDISIFLKTRYEIKKEIKENIIEAVF